MIKAICLGVACLALSLQAQAIIIHGGDIGHTTNPGNNVGWEYSGAVGSSSGVYLGNGWVITAKHVTSNPSSTFVINGFTYNGVGIGQDFINTDTTEADIYAFKVDPTQHAAGPLLNLPGLTLSQATPIAGTSGTMIGNGHGQTSDTATSYANTSLPPVPSNWEGYEWDDINSKDMRWADATFGAPTVVTQSGRITQVFSLDFQDVDNSGAAAGRDSGSGVFQKIGDDLILRGIAVAANNYDGAPASGFSAYNAGAADGGFYADLSNINYIDEFNNMNPIPEPTTGLIFAGSALLLLYRKAPNNPITTY